MAMRLIVTETSSPRELRLVGELDMSTIRELSRVLDPKLIEGHAIVGLTAGASTPEELVRATAARLAEVGYALPEEIEVAKENVHFRLPKSKFRWEVFRNSRPLTASRNVSKYYQMKRRTRVAKSGLTFQEIRMVLVEYDQKRWLFHY